MRRCRPAMLLDALLPRASARLIVAGALLAVASCKPTRRSPAAETGSSSAPSPATSAVISASAAPYVPPPQRPLAGLLCEGETGLWRLLPDGGTAPVLGIWPTPGKPHGPPTAPGSVREGSHGPDGTLYLNATPGIMRAGDPLVAVWSYPYAGADEASGDWLAFSQRGVAWWGPFQLWESPTFPPTKRGDFRKVGPPGASSFRGVTYDATDRLWVATDDAVYVREQATWTKAEIPAYPQVLGLVTFQGVAHVLLQTRLVAYPGAPIAPKTVAELPSSARTLLAGKRGVLVLLQPPEGKRGSSVVRFDGQSAKALAGTMDSLIDYDESGVVWGRDKEGFVAVDEAGKRTFWPKGSIPGFARTFTRHCHVAGHYEVLPPVGAVRFGGAKGTALRGGKPLANARFELCEELPTLTFSTKTPCGGYGMAGKTKADGTFEVEKLPIGKYHVIVDLGDKWKGTSVMGSHVLPIVAEGFTADYGALAFE